MSKAPLVAAVVLLPFPFLLVSHRPGDVGRAFADALRAARAAGAFPRWEIFPLIGQAFLLPAIGATLRWLVYAPLAASLEAASE